MLILDNVTKTYSKKNRDVHALTNIHLSLKAGEIIALIGESGSGKSTMGELIVGLETPTSGKITWDEQDNTDDLSKKGRSIQYIFQNPGRSLNPYWTIKEIMMEPFILKKVKRSEALKEIKTILKTIELPENILDKFPRQCSGGQKQRIAIGRALVCNPTWLIADEITSSLDPDTEQAVIQLLKKIHKETHLSILYITHKIYTIQDFADTMVVLKDGKIVEKGSATELLTRPTSEYTKALLRATQYTDTNPALPVSNGS